MSDESARDSRREEEEECLLELECLLSLSLLEDLDEDFDDEEDFDDLLDLSDGTSRIFRTRPVVGSVVDDWAGS